MNSNKIMKILIIMLVTAILGELKITPFNSAFRFGLGSAGFFFLLLFYRDVPYKLTGFLTGLFTIFFRIILDLSFTDSFSFLESFLSHSPIIGYYFMFSILLHYFIKRMDQLPNPLILGFIGALTDGLANATELLIINILSETDTFLTGNIQYVVTVAILRSFFVVGLFNMIQTTKLKAVYEEQRSRFEQIQTILSDLYIEVFYLKKTITEMETVTTKGHRLYQKLNSIDIPKDVSSLALAITHDAHEAKKDNQRILSGLQKVIHQENVIKPMSLSELTNLSIKANQKYTNYLKKDIDFILNIHFDSEITSIYPILIILNNLVSNAVEAINNEGKVTIHINSNQDYIIIEVIDNGIGIPAEELDVIFEPGFTTKYNSSGKPSTGIGLSHVHLMVEELHGNITVQSDTSGTSFTVKLLKSVIEAKG